MATTDQGNRYQLFTGDRTGEVVQNGEYVYFHASMRSEQDSVMFSTREAGGETPVVQVKASVPGAPEISPVEDVVRFMAVGDSAVIRVSMDDFPSKPSGMEEDSVLLYDIVVTEIVDEEVFMGRLPVAEQEAIAASKIIKELEPVRLAFAAQTVAAYNAGELDGDIKTTATGLKYLIHEEGTGKQAEAGQGVKVQYIGSTTSDGNVFDQSFGRGQAIPFVLGTGRVIPGWDQGIALLKQGAKATFFIPAELGYGAQGSGPNIPPGAELAFYVELEEIQ
jgi:FKBP-type peptidyl-prolyl cis-trans isomerase FkpA